MKSASLFMGGGLWDIGAMMAGLTPIWGVEIRPDIAAVAEANIPGMNVIVADVAAVDYAGLERVYHLHASPSCKNASQAHSDGEEAVEDMSAAMAICSALKALEPPCFTLENVWQYRDFDAFKLVVRQLRELGYCVDWWHLNAADYGVPQTRKRLILIASKDRQPRKPQPTHSKTPDPFGLYKPWVGWYESILDLIPTLPESEFAPWQLTRLPIELRTLLINGAGNTNFAEAKPGKGCRYTDEPAQTVTTITKDGGELPKALLMAQGAYDGEVVNRGDGEPSFTITSNSNQVGVRAYLAPVNGEGSNGFYDNEPAQTIAANHSSDKYRAFVIGSQYGQPNTVKDRQPQARLAAEPYFTVTVSGGTHNDQRAFVGKVVKMTPRALARFQSCPDWYQLPDANGLACEVIGNGVACLLAKAVCESIVDS